MKYQEETKNCQNCKLQFTIEAEDFNFYEKIKVPPPTFCPECRLTRRLVWMPSLTLFKRKCDLCGEEKLSMYEPEAPFKVYCPECWWSDRWDSMDFGMEIDFSKSFFEQWKELLEKTPVLALHVDSVTIKTSPYVNHIAHSKNCYMVYYSEYNEDCIFGYWLVRSKMIMDSGSTTDCEFCFDNLNSYKNYRVFGSLNTKNSLESYFLRDCLNCQNCFASVNLRNKSYVFFNKQLKKEEYLKKIKDLDLGSYKTYIENKKETQKLWKTIFPKPEQSDFSENYSGSFIYQSKNCHFCYGVVHSKDSKFLMLIKERKVSDSYDYTDWGNNAENIYECLTCGENISQLKFCHESGWNSKNLEYCKSLIGCSDCFGCISLRNKQYCILNKQYTKEEYFKLREKIIEHMDKMPYIDKIGNIYKYGEFFPMEFSPHAYNNSFANFLFPKIKEEVQSLKLRWHDYYFNKYPITIDFSEIPDNIKNTNEEILNEIIKCSNCPRGYKIVKQELDLAKKLNVPLSRQCPFCRIEERVKRWAEQMKQVNRICDKCEIEFRTHYSKEEASKIYCKKCYQKEVY
jgi:hypothetical protein